MDPGKFTIVSKAEVERKKQKMRRVPTYASVIVIGIVSYFRCGKDSTTGKDPAALSKIKH